MQVFLGINFSEQEFKTCRTEGRRKDCKCEIILVAVNRGSVSIGIFKGGHSHLSLTHLLPPWHWLRVVLKGTDCSFGIG